MLFSIIIPTCHRPDMLAKCLHLLAPGTQELPGGEYEVIVTDDSQDEATAQMMQAQFTWAQYTRGPRKGPAANRNNGARLAKGQWLVFTDDDCLPQPGWLHAYAQAIQQHPQCLAFEGAILPDNWELLKKDLAECPVNTTGGCFWSANIMVEKSLFWQVGSFDEIFPIAANEDQQLKNDIEQLSTIKFLPEAVVIHGVRLISFFSKIEKSKVLSHSWIIMMMKTGKNLSEILNRAFTNSLRYMLQAVKQGRPKSFACHLYNLIFHFPQIPFVYIKLRKLVK